MTMAATVERYLTDHQIPYELVTHRRTGSSLRTAAEARISPHSLAKAVMLEDSDGMLMAVLPADRRVQMGVLRHLIGRNVGLATEAGLAARFADCELGAVPPVGVAYGMPTMVDDELDGEPEVYLEAGDHRALMRIRHDDFERLMENAEHCRFAV